MKKIIVGKSIGFCFGVTKAVNTAKQVLKKKKCLTTLGDLVHNPIVMEELKSKGLKVINHLSEAQNNPFIIRSHGLPPDVLEELRKYTAEIYDATCPFVRKVQQLVKKLADENNFIFLVGDPDHPEIKAMEKIAGKNCLIVKPGARVFDHPVNQTRWAIIAQTTLSLDLYRNAINKILEKMPSERCTIFNTICPVSIKRQQETLKLAQKVDMLIVVGGRKSSNTRKLVHTGKKVNKNTFLVESPSDLKKIDVANFKKIGIMSGASTDERCIKEIVRILKNHPAQKNTGGNTI